MRTGWRMVLAIASRWDRATASEFNASSTTTPSLVTMMPLLTLYGDLMGIVGGGLGEAHHVGGNQHCDATQRRASNSICAPPPKASLCRVRVTSIIIGSV